MGRRQPGESTWVGTWNTDPAAWAAKLALWDSVATHLADVSNAHVHDAEVARLTSRNRRKLYSLMEWWRDSPTIMAGH